MAVSAQAEAQRRTRVRVLNPALALGGLVAVAFLLQLAADWVRATPIIFPDEYIYTSLGRSLSATGLPLVRGHAAHFPALLAPLLEAPFWLVHDVAVAYRLVQAFQALAMALAAVPAYLLARRVQLSAGAALAVAAVAVTVPDMVHSGAIICEAFAYPLVLGALLSAIPALVRPSLRTHALFLVLAGLAAFARIQFAVLPIVYVLAVVAMGARERRLRAALREQRLPLALVALGGLGLAAVGVGYYSGALHLAQPLPTVTRAAAGNLLVFAYAAAFAVVPGALLGYAYAVARPRSRDELAFAVLALALTLGVFVEATLYGESVHERYTFYALPPLAIAFLLHVRRGFPRRLLLALLAALLVVAGTLEPLSMLQAKGDVNAPVLLAVHWLILHGTAGSASLLALSAVVAAVVASLAAVRAPRVAVVLPLAAMIALGLVGWALSADFYRRNSERVRTLGLPANPSWVDASGVGDVPLVRAYNDSANSLEQLFWNRSLDRVLLLPGAQPPDAFFVQRIQIASDGTLLVGGKPLAGPLVVGTYDATVVLRHARVRARAQEATLWVPDGRPQLAGYFAGRRPTGWTAPWSRVDLWPSRPGVVRLRVTLPRQPKRSTLEVAIMGRPALRLRLEPGETRTLTLPVCRPGHWYAVLRFDTSGLVGSRSASARTGMPRFLPGAPAAGCASH